MTSAALLSFFYACWLRSIPLLASQAFSPEFSTGTFYPSVKILLLVMINSSNLRVTSILDIALMSSDFTPSGPVVTLFLSLNLLIFTTPFVIVEKSNLSRRTKVFRFLSLNVISKLSVMDSVGGNGGFFVFGGFKAFFRTKAVFAFPVRLLMFSESAIILMVPNSASGFSIIVNTVELPFLQIFTLFIFFDW